MKAERIRLLSWVRRLAQWLARPKQFWLALFVLVVAVFFVLRPGASERAIRLTGLGLQVLGIGTVIWGIRLTRRLFNRPTLLMLAAEWLRQFPQYKPKVVMAAGAGELSMVGKARAFVMNNPPHNATVDQRVASLEANVGHINRRIDGVFNELDGLESSHKSAIEKERKERNAEDQKIAAVLETSGTGGLHISAIGAVWLIVGVTLSTAAPEIAQWLQEHSPLRGSHCAVTLLDNFARLPMRRAVPF
jgi:hypothetical protein